jgi:DNA-binding response OmpR family regulator
MEFTSKIRNELNLKTPIIVISTAGQEDMFMQAFKLGADNFITKPFSPNELVKRIKKLLNLI